MGGSSGIISGVQIAPTTSQGESARTTERAVAGFPGLDDGVRRVMGIIKAAHPERPRLVKAYALDGTPIANGSWIELVHSAQEIAERWGTVRIGFRVRVLYTGPEGSGADGIIVGTEGQDIHEGPIPNEAQQGLYAIFAPGIGIG